MRFKFIIGVLALLLLMVGTASAFIIDTTNEPVPDANIKIDVIYNADADTITFVDQSVGLTNPRITWVAYNLANDAERIVGYKISGGTATVLWDEVSDLSEVEITTDWTLKNNFGAGGEFGPFERVYAVKNPGPENQFYKVVVYLSEDFDGTIPPNDNEPAYEVGAHLAWGEDGSIFVAGPPEEPEEPDVPIPEFPTIVLPVAAILGLMFIFGRRKQE